MWVTGHVATGWLAVRLASPEGRWRWAWGVCGALLPDVVDKSAKLMGLTPYGRWVGHALVVWAVWAGVAVLLRARGRGWAWWLAVGWASHIVTDLADDVVAGWLYTGYVFAMWMGWPLWTPDDGHIVVSYMFKGCRRCVTPLEVMVVGVAMWMLTETLIDETRKKRRY